MSFAVVTPGEVKFEGMAEIVVAPGAAGDLGALPNHAPMMTTLRIGVLRATVDGPTRVEFAVNAGFMEILPDKVVVLTDTAMAAADVDVEAARADLREAEAQLASNRGADDSAQRAAIAWANARLEVAHRPTA
jgi:F-type H+-transporting ATPase subunit epsilon